MNAQAVDSFAPLAPEKGRGASLPQVRVLVLTRAVPVHGSGGMEVNSLELARQLARRGCAVTILTTGHPESPSETRWEEAETVQIGYIGSGPSGAYSPSWAARSLEIATRLDCAAGFDLVHAHNSAGVALARAVHFRDRPLVVSWHGHHAAWIASALRDQRRKDGWLPAVSYAIQVGLRLVRQDSRYSRAADAVIAQDAVAAHQIRLQRLANRKTLQVIPIGVNAERFSPAGDGADAVVRARHEIPPDAPLLLAVGRLVPEKGFDDLLRAIPAVLAARPDARLLVLGVGEDEDRLRASIRRLTITGAASLGGAVHHAELPAYFRAADVVVVPTRHGGGVNTVLLEAMACGRPVVATAVAGVAAIVESDRSALLVRAGSPAGLSGAILSLLFDPLRRRCLGEAARARIEAGFDWASLAARTHALYIRLVGAASVRRSGVPPKTPGFRSEVS